MSSITWFTGEKLQPKSIVFDLGSDLGSSNLCIDSDYKYIALTRLIWKHVHRLAPTSYNGRASSATYGASEWLLELFKPSKHIDFKQSAVASRRIVMYCLSARSIPSPWKGTTNYNKLVIVSHKADKMQCSSPASRSLNCFWMFQSIYTTLSHLPSLKQYIYI